MSKDEIERFRSFSPFVKDTTSEMLLRSRGLGGWFNVLPTKITFPQPAGYISVTNPLFLFFWFKKTVVISRAQARSVFVKTEHYSAGASPGGVPGTSYSVKVRVRSGHRARELTIYTGNTFDEAIARYVALRIREFSDK